MVIFFIILVLIYEDHGVFVSITRSVRLFRKMWGETFVTSFGFGLIFFLLGFVGIVPILVGFILFGFTGLLIGLVISVIYWVILSLIASAAQGVLVAVLYRYVTIGKISPEFDHVSHFFLR